MPNRNSLTFYLLLLLILFVVGVGLLTKFEEAPDSDLEPSVEDKTTSEVIEQPTPMPNIYIDQIITPATAENRRELYADLLTICQEEDVSIQALTETEMSQLGTIRLQRWIDENRTAYRLESWDFQLEEPQQQPHCHFQLISSGVEWGFEPHSDGIKSVSDTHHYALFRSLVLQQVPAGNALDKISTITFNIGEKLDEAAMQPTPATALPAEQP